MTKLLKSVLLEDVVFIDCGANHGYYTMLASELIPDKQIFAVEASKDTFSKLSEGCRINQINCNLFNFAISAASGDTVEFVTVSENHAGACIKDAKASQETIKGKSETVSTIKIDDVVGIDSRNTARRFVIKIDVEGVEIEAFKGSSWFFDKETIYIFEDLTTPGGEGVCEYLLNSTDLIVFSIRDDGSLFQLKDKKHVDRERRCCGREALNFAALTKEASESSWINALLVNE